MVDADKQIKIALVGKKAAGKTFIAFRLRRDYGFKRIRLQDGVDRIVKVLYGLEKMKRPSWEQRLYFYDALYKVDPNIFVNYALRRLQTTTMPYVVVEDCRYINEISALASNGFTIVRVTTPDDDVRRRHISKGLRGAAAGSIKLTEYFNTDPSRTYQVDYNILNTTREETKLSVNRLIEQLTRDT